eukprot:TRINITY_DN11378_c1_g1_i2.p1 TRINITY_DN11378_c1_g1~~TRINITY_DN11378_c1_g1_i2.p1  ORF type:complete len:988 (+),score=278.10 TRINITY_DN11378_c1_g1_i2:32-2995(+)
MWLKRLLRFKLSGRIRAVVYIAVFAFVLTSIMTDTKIQIHKPPNDNREYRFITLPNDLKCIVIHDATTEKAAITADVAVGSLSNPKDYPGLAHFTEHMLFLGTDKYPEENEYSRYLSEHGGWSNAFTSDTDTVYFCTVDAAALPGTLDRFAQFFIAPRMDASCTEREIQAVNSEHEKNLDNDYWRLHHLDRVTSAEGHPYNSFSTGNLRTLWDEPNARNEQVRERLLQFHQEHYSANRITVSILGRESLDELSAMVTEAFSPVVNKKLEPIMIADHPYDKEQLPRMLQVVPVKEQREVTLSFPIKDESLNFKTQIGHYLAHLIGHEGAGSLLSYLKAQDLASGLSAGDATGFPGGYGFFKITISLTTKGLDQLQDVIEAIFSYIAMLKAAGPKDYIFEECKQLEQMDFQFLDKQQPYSTTMMVARALRNYPPQHVLDYRYALADFDKEGIVQLVENLTPDNVKIAVMSKSFKGNTTNVEDVYGTEHNNVAIPNEWLNAWRAPSPRPELHLPPPNVFIPTDFALVPALEEPAQSPVLLEDSDALKVWHQQDTQFQLPKTSLNLMMRTNAHKQSVRQAVCTSLLFRLVKDIANEFAYDAELGGLDYHLQGMQVTVRGYSQKLSKLLTALLETFGQVEAKVTPERFVSIVDDYRRSMEGMEKDQPYHQVSRDSDKVLLDVYYSHLDRLPVLPEITLEEVIAWAPQLLKSMQLEMLILGNINSKDALALAKSAQSTLQEQFKTIGTPLAERPLPRCYAFPQGYTMFARAAPVVDIHAVTLSYKFGARTDLAVTAMVTMIGQLLSESFFDSLRTKEQLGYVVYSHPGYKAGTDYLSLVVQSNRKPGYLIQRVLNFLTEQQTALKSMDEEQFEAHKSAAITKLLDKPKNLKALAGRYWPQITSGCYAFDRNERMAELIKSLTKDACMQAYNRVFMEVDTRQCVIIARYGSKAEPFSPSQVQGDLDEHSLTNVALQDVDEFHHAADLMPQQRAI